MKSFNQNGDTVVEVLISVAIAGMALGASYSLANKSIRTGIESRQRTEAIKIIEGQIEQLKNAYFTTPTTFDSTFRSPIGYCMVNSFSSTACSFGDNGAYTVQITYIPTTQIIAGKNNGIFTFTVNWQSLTSAPSGQNNIVIYYRL